MGVTPMWAEDLEKLADDWAAAVEAGTKPSLPHLTDEWEPTNANLWQDVLEVAEGKRRDLTSGDRTIHAPNEGLGFHPWPHPKGVAWAVKQYNGFGGKWQRKKQGPTAAAKLNGDIIPDAVPMGDYQFRSVRDLVPGRRKEPKNPPRGERIHDLVDDTEAKNETQEEVDESWQDSAPPIDPKKQQAEADRETKGKASSSDLQALNFLQLGAVIETRPYQEEHKQLQVLQAKGLVQGSECNGRTYWDITRVGSMLVVANLGNMLRQKMDALLEGEYDLAQAKALGKWFGDNFRVQSPQTPRGQKELKTKAEALRWYLSNGTESYADSVRSTWEKDIEPHLADLVQYFSDEGQVIPKDLQRGSITYENEVGVSQDRLEKYVDRLGSIFDKLRGWHAKALKGNLTVVLASPRNFRGTAGGKYKHSEGGKLLIRATPSVLRRSGGSYGSFEYIIVHELGHRFEYKNRLPMDFDKPEWWTTKYSRKEGESFAELFALSHFKLHGPWDDKIVERFQKLMSGQGDTSKPELPEHLRALSGT